MIGTSVNFTVERSTLALFRNNPSVTLVIRSSRRESARTGFEGSWSGLTSAATSLMGRESRIGWRPAYRFGFASPVGLAGGDCFKYSANGVPGGELRSDEFFQPCSVLANWRTR